MELNITVFFNGAVPFNYSASAAEMGQDAGPSTWRNAVQEAAKSAILDTEEKREAFRTFVRESGGWDDDEIAAWSNDELTALCIQWIAGDMREPVGFELGANSTDADWAAYQAQSEAGNVSGRLFKAEDGDIYWMCE